METEADRLASIKALGGQLVRAESGDFWAIFDREYLESVDTETRSPALTARTSDAERCAPRKGGAAVSVGVEIFRVRRHEKNSPAPDWTIIILES
jgi:hypothetical protein